MKFTMIRRITALGLILVLAAGIPIQASSASTEKVTEDADDACVWQIKG